jgi:TolB-like protein/Flp pilus assembly protein TadD
MSSEQSSDVKFEIGHVLFIDIVGYSKLLINEQSEQIQTLREIVRGTEQFRLAEAQAKLMRLPTGDGGALVFRTTPEAPILCALEISKALKSHPELHVRMGIHSGPVNEVTDLNEQANIAGAGINIAQRVMDCGDAGHILVSKRVADDLEQYPQWRSRLRDLGECEVKHGVRVGIVNLCGDEIGNPQIPKKLQGAKERRTRARWTAIGIALLLLSGVGAAFIIVSRKSVKSTFVVPEKSIAVLPFENLSEDKSNAYFSEGIQDEILTRLAKIGELKVVSRTSTQRFKSSPDDVLQIAQKLGVANVLEGSVQKENDQVRVNVQLIKAADDTHLWADTYDRRLTDIFAVESEIAKAIADTLRARLTGAELTAIAKAPTADNEAHDLYLKGRFFWNKRTSADMLKSIVYYNGAIAKDPNYAFAYAGLADSYALLSVFGAAAPQDSIPQARAAAKKALEFDDSLAEAHASVGRILTGYDFDFLRAIAEFERAIALDPNYATAHHWLGWGPLSALGQFDRAIVEGKRAVELDPLSSIDNADLGLIYIHAGRYDDAIAQLRKTIELDPYFYVAPYYLGIAFQLNGQVPEAISAYQKAAELNDDPENLAYLGQAYARTGRRSDAQTILAQLTQQAKSRYVSAYSLAVLLLALGEKDRAMDELERAYREGAGNDIFTIKIDPALDDLRGEPRFEALVQKIFAANR